MLRELREALPDADRRLRRVLAPLDGDYDVAFLDCPPSISLVSESVFDAGDALLVPIIPTTLSVRTYDQLVRFVSTDVARRPEVIAFFSMVDRRKRLHRDIVATLPTTTSGVARAAIPAASDVERLGLHRVPLCKFALRAPATRAYEALWLEVCGRVLGG